MEMDSFTDRSRGFIQAAQTAAVGRGHQRFSPLHLLQALLADGEGVASRLVSAAGGDVKRVTAAVEADLGKLPQVAGDAAGQLYMTPELARVLEAAKSAATAAGDSFVTVEYLLLAMVIADAAPISTILADGGVTKAGWKPPSPTYARDAKPNRPAPRRSMTLWRNTPMTSPPRRRRVSLIR